MYPLIHQLSQMPHRVREIIGKIENWKQPTTNGDRECVADPNRHWEAKIAPWCKPLMVCAIVWFCCGLLIPAAKSDMAGILWMFGLAVLLFLEGIASNRHAQLARIAKSLRPIVKFILGGISTILEFAKLAQGIASVSQLPPQILRHYTNRIWNWESNQIPIFTALKMRPNVQPLAPSN